MPVPLYLGHRCSKLRVLPGRFFSLMSIMFPSVSFFMTFGLKYILSDIRIATTVFFPGTNCLETSFPAFYSEVVFLFDTEMGFLYAAKCWALFLNPVC